MCYGYQKCIPSARLYRQYWKMTGKDHKGLKGPYPMADMWPALPAVIDTTFEDHLTKKIYFFSGTRILPGVHSLLKNKKK